MLCVFSFRFYLFLFESGFFLLMMLIVQYVQSEILRLMPGAIKDHDNLGLA